MADGIDTRVIFEANEDYWGGTPDINRLEIVHYATAGEVKDALLNGELDLVWGAGVLSDSDIVEIQKDPVISEQIKVDFSTHLQNVILLLNTGKPPFDDINVRKTVFHAINKAAIVETELNGLHQVVDNVFPRAAPYCGVNLTPRWDYDFEKAVLLSCGGTAGSFAPTSNNGDTETPGVTESPAPSHNGDTAAPGATESPAPSHNGDTAAPSATQSPALSNNGGNTALRLGLGGLVVVFTLLY